MDMDGVVLCSMQAHANAWQEVLADAGISVSRSFILEHEGCLDAEVLGKLPGAPSEPKARERLMHALLERQRRIYLERYAADVRPYPGVQEFLKAARAKALGLALVTSSTRALVRQALPGEVVESFQVVITSEDVSRHKPHPEPYLTAARRLGVSPEECVVIENAPAGIASARAAGMTCIALTTTLAPAHLASASVVLSTLEEAGRWLGLNGKG